MPMSAAWQRCTQSSSTTCLPSGGGGSRKLSFLAVYFFSTGCTRDLTVSCCWSGKAGGSVYVCNMVSVRAVLFVLSAVTTYAIGAPSQLPDTSGIDFVLTDTLNIDQFFSLWLVFNNDDVRMSGMFWNSFLPFLSDVNG